MPVKNVQSYLRHCAQEAFVPVLRIPYGWGFPRKENTQNIKFSWNHLKLPVNISPRTEKECAINLGFCVEEL